MFALPGVSPPALPSAVVWHERNRAGFCALGQKWDGAGAQQLPFNAKTMKNGFLSVCPYSVVGMCSHIEQCVQGGILLLPAIPCTIPHGTSQNVTCSWWHLCADLKTSQLFPPKCLCHPRKTRRMFRPLLLPSLLAFPSQTQHTWSFQSPKIRLKITLIYKYERPQGYSSDKWVRKDIIGTEACVFKLLIHIFGHRVGTF